MVRMTDQEFTELTTFVKSKYGIDLTKKRVLIESRLSHELHQRGITSFQQYLDLVRKDQSGTEMTTMLNKLTTNLSFFMREQGHFDYLSKVVLTDICRPAATTSSASGAPAVPPGRRRTTWPW